ncbi:hypothetical protein ACNHYB_05665 [Isoptericola jiangsuensis]|uniref:hypothetical protein n=1 Tax=Isoptericola jiangsuensis TaxID=548579 RepID=UPI003AAB58CD
MQPLEWATQFRVTHDELVAEAQRYRRARAAQAARRSLRVRRTAPAHLLTARHRWWHGTVELLHRLWSPRPATAQHDRATARNVG